MGGVFKAAIVSHDKYLLVAEVECEDLWRNSMMKKAATIKHKRELRKGALSSWEW
jgi:hypothetical protein